LAVFLLITLLLCSTLILLSSQLLIQQLKLSFEIMIASDLTKVAHYVLLHFCANVFNLQHYLKFKAFLVKLCRFCSVNLRAQFI